VEGPNNSVGFSGSKFGTPSGVFGKPPATAPAGSRSESSQRVVAAKVIQRPTSSPFYSSASASASVGSRANTESYDDDLEEEML
jgi:hypothetical protein